MLSPKGFCLKKNFIFKARKREEKNGGQHLGDKGWIPWKYNERGEKKKVARQLFGLESLSRYMQVKNAKVFVNIDVYFTVALRKLN